MDVSLVPGQCNEGAAVTLENAGKFCIIVKRGSVSDNEMEGYGGRYSRQEGAVL